MTLRIGTRGSPLALRQANQVADALRCLTTRDVVLVEIETAGDQVRDVPISQLGGEGAFTKEIQKALLTHTVDVAVHSLKDLPTVPVAGLTLAAVPVRAPAHDVLISPRFGRFYALPKGAMIATSSIRRQAQALYRRPDLQLVNIRGNIETRLRKLDEQVLDALILAEAGLRRLSFDGFITDTLTWMMPAVGQGALGLECRSDDSATLEVVARLDDPRTRAAVTAERALLHALGGGCQVPLGVRSEIEGDQLCLMAAVFRAVGTERIDAALTGHIDYGEQLGLRLADLLRAQGADRLLAR